jgi:phage-related protein
MPAETEVFRAGIEYVTKGAETAIGTAKSMEAASIGSAKAMDATIGVFERLDATSKRVLSGSVLVGLSKVRQAIIGTRFEAQKFSTQAQTFAESTALMMEPARMGLLDFLSVARIAFKEIRAEGGNLAAGMRTIAGAAATTLRQFESMRGVVGILDSVSRVAGRFSLGFGRASLSAKELSKDLSQLLRVSSDMANSLNVQGVAFRTLFYEQQTAFKSLLYNLRSVQAAKDTDAQKTQQAIALLQKFGVASADIHSVEDALARTNDKLAMMNAQGRELSGITQRMQSLSHSVKMLRDGYEATGRWSDKLSRRAMGHARSVETEINRFRAMGGVVNEQMAGQFQAMTTQYKQLVDFIRHGEREAKRLGDSVQAGATRGRQGMQGLNETVQRTSTRLREYTQRTREAAMSNRMLMQYVTPRGITNTGLMHIGANATRASQSVQTFSMSLGSIIGTAGAIGGALGKLDPAFSAVIVGVSRMADQFMRSFGAMMSVAGTASEKIKAAMGIISNSLLAFGTMAIGLITKTGLLAAEVETMEMTMTTIARNLADEAGISADRAVAYISKLRETIKEMGITTREATSAVSTFLRARLPVERLGELAESAKNFGVTVANMSTSQVLGRFIYFITSGNTRLLRTIGITKTSEQMLAEYAKTIGKTSKALTPLEKQYGRIAGIIKETESVQGVYNKAMQTAGKQLSSMKRLFEEALLTIGERFLPIITKLVFGMNNLLKRFLALDSKIHDNIAGVIKWVATGGLMQGILLAILPGLKAFIGLLGVLLARFARMAPKMFLISVALKALMVIVKAVKRAWDLNLGGIQDTIIGIVDTIKSYLKPIIDDLVHWFSTFGKQIRTIIRHLSEIFGQVFALIASLRAEGFNLAAVFRTLQSVINGFMRAIMKVLMAVTAILKGDWKLAWKYAEEAVIDALTSIALLFQNIIAKAAVWGWNLIAEVANGITKAVTTILARVMKWLGEVIGKYLAPGSPPELGPLKHIARWGRGIMETYLRAFGLADFGILRDIMSPIAAALKGAVAAGTIGEKQLAPLTAAVRKDVAALLVQLRETGELSGEIMDRISKKLGEGGKDILDYIRRIVAHQKAMERLKIVEEEVAAAERAGFVPKALRDKLDTAKKEVNAAKEAVDWQKEFLAAQQDSVDLQLKQLAALEKMASAVEKVAAAAEEAFTWELPPTDEIKGIFPDIGEALGLGAVSEEWLEMRDRIEGVIAGIKEFLALPLGKQIELIGAWLGETGGKIITWLEDLTGLDISGWLGTLETKWDTAWGVVKTWATTTWASDIEPKLEEFKLWLDTHLPAALETARLAIETVWNWIVEKTKWMWEQIVGESYVPDTVEGTISWFEKLELWFKNTKLYTTIEGIVNFFGSLLNFAKALAITTPPAILIALAGMGKLGPIITGIVAAIGNFVELFAAGGLVAGEALGGIIGAAAPVVATIAGIGAAIAAFVYGVWENRDLILGFWEDLKFQVTDAVNRIRPSVEKIWGAVKPIFTAIAGVVGVVIGVIGSLAIAIIPALLRAVSTILPKVAGFFKGVFTAVYGIIQTFILAPINLIIAAINALTGDTEEGTASLEAAWNNFKDGIGNILNGILEAIGNFVTGAFELITNFAANLLEGTADAFAGLLDLLGFEEQAEAIRTFFDDAYNKAAETWEQIKFILVYWINEAAVAVADWKDDMVEKWQDVVDKIKAAGEDIGEAIDSVIEWFGDLITKTELLISDGWDALSGAVEDAGLILEGLIDLVKTMIDEGLAAWQTNLENLKVIWDEVMGKIKDAIDTVLNPLKEAWDAISGAIQSVLDKIPKINLPKVEIPDWMKGKSPPPMASWLTDIADAMDAMGKASIDLDRSMAMTMRDITAQVTAAVPVSPVYNSRMYDRGAFEGAFPNVVTGEDAGDVLEVIENKMSRGRNVGWIGSPG